MLKTQFYKMLLFIATVCAILALAHVVFASGPNFNDTTNQAVTNAINPNFSVNVGIGSSAPGQKLDVQGTVRTMGFTMSGQTPVSGYVLTASDSSGDTTWSTPGSVGSNYWLNTAAAGNVGISTTNTVGIGTTSAGAGAGLVVMNGNVGIGSIYPGQILDVQGQVRAYSPTDVPAIYGVGTTNYAVGVYGTASGSGNGDPAVYGNNTGAGFGVEGYSSTGTGVSAISGGGQTSLAISAGNGYGNGILSSVSNSNVYSTVYAIEGSNTGNSGYGIIGQVTGGTNNGYAGYFTNNSSSGWGVYSSGSSPNYFNGNVGINSTTPGQKLDVQGTVRGLGEIINGNIGIGTSFVNGSGEAALTVMNGNVGIGTWLPGTTLDVQGKSNTIRGRYQCRIVTVTQSATPAIDTDNGDVFEMTGLAQAVTSMTSSLTGTPNDGDIIEIQITDNGTARSITWGTSFESTGTVTLPATTVASTRLNIFLQWSAADSKWMCVGFA